MARGPRGGGGAFLGVCLPYFSFLWSLWCSFFIVVVHFRISCLLLCFYASRPQFLYVSSHSSLFARFFSSLSLFSALLRVTVPISLFFLDTSALPLTPAGTFPARRGTWHCFSNSRAVLPAFASQRWPACARVRGSRLWELSLPGPRLPVGWVRPGIRSGEHWLHKDLKPPGPAAPPPRGRAGGLAGRRGLCNAEVTEVGHACLGNHPASVCGGQKGGLAPRCPVTHCHRFLSHDPWLK